jgi:hypothetical protein
MVAHSPEDVFITVGLPEHTYVAVEQGKKEAELQDGLSQKNKIISISGPSKCGKTTLCDKMFGTQNGVDRLYVTGDRIQKGEDLWLEAYRQATDDTAPNYYELSNAQQLDTLVAVELPLIIDDFHYIPHEIQPGICRQMKNAAASGLSIICLTVPHRRNDPIRDNPDLSGRFFSVNFSFWELTDLERIAMEGFPLVGYPCLPWFNSRLAEESLTSPQIMQTLCLEACRIEGLDKPLESSSPTEDSIIQIKRRALRSYDNASAFQILKTGPVTRGRSRRRYETISDSPDVYLRRDVYECLIAALGKNPPFQQLSLGELQQRVQRILHYDDEPDIRKALLQLQKLFTEKAQPLDWDDEKRLLTIIDPHFYFYLRNFESTTPIS